MDVVQRARRAAGLTFAVHGVGGGSWAARVPWVQDHLGLSAGTLGAVLVVPALGAVAALPTSGRLVGTVGSRRAAQLAMAGLAVAVGVVTAVPRLPWVVAVLFCSGVLGALADIAMNDNAVAVEQRLGRPIMSGLHARWSIGALVGGTFAALAAHLNVGAPVHLAAVGAVMLALGAVATYGLLRLPVERSAETLRFAWPGRDILLLGVLCAAAMFAEGAANEWSAVYAHRVIGAAPGTAATAYTAFAVAMVTGRLAGDRVVARLGPVATLRLAGTLGAAGATAVALARALPLALGGFGLLGLGLAVGVPLAFGAAGHRGGARSGHAIAAVATLGYGGWLAGPGLIGGIGQAASLPVSFAVVAGVAALLVVLAGTARPPDDDGAVTPG